jgi:SulP family sulfate permease
LFVLAFMAGLGPLMAYVPLASLAAVLIVVAWNMAERERFLQLIGVRNGDSVVLLATFGLTVLVDLTLAIEVGVVLGAIMFMHRMAEATAIEKGAALIERDRDDFGGDGKYDARAGLPAGVEMFELRGPLFFGAASRLADALDAAFPPPKVFILRMKEVPMADASGVGALDRFLRRCAKHDVPVIISELGERPAAVLKRAGLLNQPNVHVRESFAAALDLSRSHVQ